jgi:Zn-dependent protease with chaperone function
MKYQPSLPEHNDNVSQQNPLKDFFVIMGWLVAITACVFWLLGLAVDAVVDRLDHADEARLYALMPAHAAPAAGADPRQTQLQALVDGMRQCAGLQLPATVTLNKSDDANAAVMPGGHVIVFSGLLDQVKSENGLSFVLAHELAHITQRDHLRAMGRGIVLFGLSALLTGSDSGLTELLAPVNSLGHAKYSRTREAAADAAALRILDCRYGHAGGATELFQAMQARDGDGFGISHYVASHPAMQERIDTLNRAIRDGGMTVGPVSPKPSPR